MKSKSNPLNALSESEILQRIKLPDSMTPEQSYHAFLIRQRIFCQYETDWHSCYRRAVTVRNFNGSDLTLCAEHASRLDAARESEKRQDAKPS